MLAALRRCIGSEGELHFGFVRDRPRRAAEHRLEAVEGGVVAVITKAPCSRTRAICGIVREHGHILGQRLTGEISRSNGSR